jgi:hypothetical protein
VAKSGWKFSGWPKRFELARVPVIARPGDFEEFLAGGRQFTPNSVSEAKGRAVIGKLRKPAVGLCWTMSSRKVAARLRSLAMWSVACAGQKAHGWKWSR